MSVSLPVEMCSWEREFTYLVRDVPSSLVVSIWFMKCVDFSGYVFKRGSHPYMFSTIWIYGNNSSIPSRRRIYLFDCYFNPWGDNIINRGQNCVLDSILDRINKKPIFLSILSVRHLYMAWIITVFSFGLWEPSILFTVTSRSLGPWSTITIWFQLLTASPTKKCR